MTSSVPMNPGQIAFTCTPSPRISIAQVLVSEITATFAAA